MAWEDFVPFARRRTGEAGARECFVSAAVRVPKDRRAPVMVLLISSETVAALGWTVGQRVRVQTDAETRRFRISLAPDGIGWSLIGQRNLRLLTVALPLPGLPTSRQRAARQKHSIEAGALIVAAPAWWKPQPETHPAVRAIGTRAPAPTPPAHPAVRVIPATPRVSIMDRVRDPAAALRGPGR